MLDLLKRLLSWILGKGESPRPGPKPSPQPLPAYIDRGGMTVYPQPVVAPGMEMYGFAMSADRAALQGVCDRYLNAPLLARGEPARFKSLGSFALLTVATLPRLTSKPSPYDQQTWLEEREVAFWMGVSDSKSRLPMMFNPYIFVDHPWALSAGREIYGYPKEFAWLTLPETRDNADSFAMDTIAVEAFGIEDPARSQATRRRLLEIRRVGGKFKELGVGLEDLILELGKILLGEEPGLLPAFAHLLESWVASEKKMLDVLLLKQFRNLGDGLEAHYQEVVRAHATLGKIHGLGLTGLYNIDIKSLQSHPIVAHLGLHPSAGSIRAPGFWIEVDFELGNGGPVSPAAIADKV